MTEQEFYELKVGDEVEYNGDRYKFNYNFHVRHGYGFSLAKMFRCEKSEMFVYQCGEKWFNSIVTSDDKTLGNLKLIKSNVPTIDQQIQETKSEIEKLQIELKKLESEKNSKRIEQLISEMVPGKFYTIVSKNYIETGIYKGKDRIHVSILPIHYTYDINILHESIKDIIPREDITNDYNNLMEKIKKYNGE